MNAEIELARRQVAGSRRQAEAALDEQRRKLAEEQPVAEAIRRAQAEILPHLV